MKRRLILFVLLLVIGIVGCGLGDDGIQTRAGSESEDTTADTAIRETSDRAAGEATDMAAKSGNLPEAAGEDSRFEVHFIDVGQADAALVLCDGKSMLIDGGNRNDSSLIYSYLKERGIDRLDYVVCTHPHEDHAGGLAGALNYAKAGVAYAPVEDYDNVVFGNFKKYLEKQGVTVTVPSAGETFGLGSAEVSVIGPTGNEAGGNVNNTSIVLRVVYGETSFLFTGDAEREEEQAILEAGYEIQSTVLKVGHHGGATSTTYPFLRETAPEYAVISVGAGNSYGHPTEDVLSRLRDADVQVYRTDRQGTVICKSDGQRVSFEAGKTGRGDTAPQEPVREQEKGGEESLAEAKYVLNIKSMKFHDPSCQSVYDMKEANKQFYTGEREELLEQGYSPCGRCRP